MSRFLDANADGRPDLAAAPEPGGIGQWAKALNGTAVAGLAACITALQDGRVQPNEWLTIAGTILGTFLAVAFIRNATDGWRRYLKTILGGLLAFVGALATGGVEGGISQAQWLVAFSALLTALPVWWSSNAAESDTFRLARQRAVQDRGVDI